MNDEAIEAMAASWLVQRDEGFSAEQADAFARWLTADPRHATAVAFLEETCGILEKMPLVRSRLESESGHANPAVVSESSARYGAGSSPAAANRSGRVLSFPIALKTAIAVAACIAVAMTLWVLPRSSRGDVFLHTYATTAEKYLRVRLPDESVLELNAQTEVRVQFSKLDRRVTLAQGEAHFTVAKNPARPFFVNAGNVAVRAVGTAFNVRMDKTSIDVLVTEGRVQVTKDVQGAATNPLATSGASLFVAGQRVIVSTEGATAKEPIVTQLDSTAIRDVLAWQSPSPMLVFGDTPLSEVVLQFNRHDRIQLAIADAELGVRPVGGTFRADQVETFVTLFEKSGDISIERPAPDRIVLRKAGAAR